MNKKVLIAVTVTTVLLITGFILYFKNKSETQTGQGILGMQTSEVSALRKAVGKDELIVGIDEAFPPISFKDIDGSYAGIDIDWAKEVEKRSGVKMTAKPIEWDSIIPALLSKDIDIIWSGMGITPERAQKVNFVTYSKGPKGVAFTLASTQINSKDELSGKVIAVQSGSYQETDLKTGKIIPVNSWKEIRSMSTLPEAILDLKLGRVDAVIAGPDSANYYIQKTLNQAEKFKMVDVGYSEGQGGIALRKEDTTIQTELQKVVEEIIKDGTASKITLKWLGVDKYANWSN